MTSLTNSGLKQTPLHGNFVEKWWKEHFGLSRRTFEYITRTVRVAGPDLAYLFAMKTNVENVIE